MKTTIYSVQPHFQTSHNPEVDWQQEEIEELKQKNRELENANHYLTIEKDHVNIMLNAISDAYRDLMQQKTKCETELAACQNKLYQLENAPKKQKQHIPAV